MIVAAALYQNEIGLIVTHDKNGNLYLSALCIHRSTKTKDGGSGRDRPGPPFIEALGSSLPLTQYPNSISIVKQGDGVIYAIVCAAKRSGTCNPNLSHRTELLSLSAIFKVEDKQGLVRIDPTTDYWALDKSSKSAFRIATLNQITALRCALQ